jgi:hypothetical protein
VKVSREARNRSKRAQSWSFRLRGLTIALCFVWIGLAPLVAPAEVNTIKAAQVKAAYLRYIAEFTTWPPEALGEGTEPIVLGATGTDPHGVTQILERAIERKGLLAQNRQLVLLRMPEPGSADFEAALEKCHLLFMSGSEGGVEGWAQVRELLADRPIVTIGELSGFSLAEGMIEFVIDPGTSRVTMHIDLEAVQRAKLRLSSRLLSLKQGVKIVRAPVADDACAAGSCDEGSPGPRFGQATLPRQDRSLVNNTMPGRN